MAKRTTVVIHDDLDQSEGARTIKFGLDGKSYEIDLSPAHEEELRKALQKFLDAASPVLPYATPTSTRRKYGTGPVRRDTKHIREWLRGHEGLDISDRGRIPIEYMQRYEAAHPSR
jgi:hypothetical protein